MSDLTELQEHLNTLKAFVAKAEQVKHLKEDPNFKELITEGFCIKEMQRYMGLAVSEKADPSLRSLCENSAKAGAILDSYLNTILKYGDLALAEIEEVQNTITELEVKGEKND